MLVRLRNRQVEGYAFAPRLTEKQRAERAAREAAREINPGRADWTAHGVDNLTDGQEHQQPRVNFCSCNNCPRMPLAAEEMCCKSFPYAPESQSCIIQDENFRAAVLNQTVIEIVAAHLQSAWEEAG